jgi:hypothetical protein
MKGLAKINSRRLKNVDTSNDILVRPIGGTVGKLKGPNIKTENLGLQFAYRDGDKDYISPIYLLDPVHARFVGKNLLALGIKEGLSAVFKNTK